MSISCDGDEYDPYSSSGYVEVDFPIPGATKDAPPRRASARLSISDLADAASSWDPFNLHGYDADEGGNGGGENGYCIDVESGAEEESDEPEDGGGSRVAQEEESHGTVGELLEKLVVTGEAPPTLHELFQRSLEELVANIGDMSSESAAWHSLLEASICLERVARDFIHQATLYAKVIISELALPVKTISPISVGGVLGGSKYICNGILFKFGDGSIFSGYPDPLFVAHKIQGHEFKGLCSYFAYFFNRGLLSSVAFPMAAVIDYKGHRITAMTLLPISGKETLIYGSNNAGSECNVRLDDEDFVKSVTDASLSMGLKLHRVLNGRSTGNDVEIASCVDLEGHRGRDGRFYLLDYSRAMPPAYKTPEERKAHPWDSMWPFYHMLRPEFVASYGTPLSADAFSGFCAPSAKAETQADMEEVRKATTHLQEQVVASVAERLTEAAEREEFCSISQAMHSCGLNMRYLGLLYGVMMKKGFKLSHQNTYTAIQAEALSRVLKNRLRSAWRATSGLESVLLPVTTRILNDFFGKDTTDNWLAKNSYVIEELVGRFHFTDRSARFVVSACLTKREVETGNTLHQQSHSVKWVVLEALCKAAGIAVRDAAGCIERSYRQAIVFSDMDFSFHERIKQLNVVDRAQGLELYIVASQCAAEDPAIAYERLLYAYSVIDSSFASFPSDSWFAFLLAQVCVSIWRLLRSNPTFFESESEAVSFFFRRADTLFAMAVAGSYSSWQALRGYGEFLLEAGEAGRAKAHISRALDIVKRGKEAPILSSLMVLCISREREDLRASQNDEAREANEKAALGESRTARSHVLRLMSERIGRAVARTRTGAEIDGNSGVEESASSGIGRSKSKVGLERSSSSGLSRSKSKVGVNSGVERSPLSIKRSKSKGGLNSGVEDVTSPTVLRFSRSKGGRDSGTEGSASSGISRSQSKGGRDSGVEGPASSGISRSQSKGGLNSGVEGPASSGISRSQSKGGLNSGVEDATSPSVSWFARSKVASPGTALEGSSADDSLEGDVGVKSPRLVVNSLDRSQGVVKSPRMGDNSLDHTQGVIKSPRFPWKGRAQDHESSDSSQGEGGVKTSGKKKFSTFGKSQGK